MSRTRPASRVLVVGGGGREHALCWRIRRDRPQVELSIAPGNGGTDALATAVPISAGDIEAIVAWCVEQRPDLVVIGPDDPLAAGLVDALTAVGVRAFGPTAAAARIESSKAWATQVCEAAGVPMPVAHVFDSADAADAFVRASGSAFVVKADGLALGKGVVVPDSVEGTIEAIDRLMRGRAYGSAGERIVLQERLRGPEASIFAICDGTSHRVIGAARDYKRVGDGDEGPNTGGMGAYAPLAEVDAGMLSDIEAGIIGPVLGEMRRRGAPFVGFLYAGLMLTSAGPKVIEFNARLGDPEAQVILPLLGFDLLAAMEAALDGRLDDLPLPPATSAPGVAAATSAPGAAAETGAPGAAGAAVSVVLASDGYPGTYRTGCEVHGADVTAPATLVFHAGTRRADGRLVTAGGRVLAVTGLGPSVQAARARAYAGVDTISFDGAVRRSDVAAGIA